jgi:hypothetical protein
MSALVMRPQHQSTAPVAPKPSVEQPVLLAAINLTLRTMERRLRWYRNLVVCFSLTFLISLILALVFRKWLVLTGWLALPLFVACFLYLDARTLRAWRDRVLEMRDQRGLDVAQLEQTLKALRHIPEATLRSLFAMVRSDKPNR